MNIPETIKTLTEYNKWRRDPSGDLTMINPIEIGIAIDSAIRHLNTVKRMKTLKKKLKK